jgi:hypothetical protein
MPDLHDWITEQVARAERIARAPQHPSPHWHYDHMCGEIRDDANAGTVAHLGRDDPAGVHIALHDPGAVLRRCEADCQILAIHAAVDDGYSTGCDGCGTAGICDDWVTDNINDCPILLAVAHAHGLTPEILAELDRPEPPQRAQMSAGPALNPDAWARYLITGQLPARTAMRDVPAALRGPNWRP